MTWSAKPEDAPSFSSHAVGHRSTMTDQRAERTDPEVDAMEERLEDLDRGIDDAREAAREHGMLPDPDEPTWEDPNPEGAEPDDDLNAMP